jgi:hypothetical protein
VARHGITRLSRHGESQGRVSRELHVGIDCPELVDEDGLHGKQWSSPGLVRSLMDMFLGRMPTEEDVVLFHRLSTGPCMSLSNCATCKSEMPFAGRGIESRRTSGDGRWEMPQARGLEKNCKRRLPFL